VFTSPTQWYRSFYPVFVSIYGGSHESHDGASSISLATAAVVAVAAVMALA